MKVLARALAILLMAVPSAASAATVATPPCMNATGSVVPCVGVTPVDTTGNPLSWSALFGSISGAGGTAYTGPVASQLPASLGAKAGVASLPIVPATDATFPVSGSLSISNFPASQAVTGTFWQAVQPISVATLPLPAGAALASNQTSELTKLDTMITSLNTAVTNLASIISNTSGIPTGSPIRTFDETNAIAGRGFSWGTGVISVASGSRLNVVFTNPTGSGKTAYIVLREFGQSSANALTATLYTNPSIPSGSTTTNGGNRLMGSSTASVSTFSYQIATTALATGTAGSSVFIAPNGENTDTAILRIVPPGFSFGYTVMAPGGGFTAATSISVSFAGWEQ